METLWWKFELPGIGTHQVRVKNIGAPGQLVHLDGNHVAAPDDQLVFTGPGGALLEFQRQSNGWVLLVDGVLVEGYNPNAVAPVLWKFDVPGLGQHQLRIKNLGEDSQEVTIDGAPVEAPPGTTTFTGPGACLLQVSRGGVEGWVLHVDGVYCPQSVSSCAPVTTSKNWEFDLPNSGVHRVNAVNLGLTGHQVYIDGVPLAAPEGTTTFTGPEGVLLQFQYNGEAWSLYVDGVQLPDMHSSSLTAPADALWNFAMLDPSKTFSSMHQMRVIAIGAAGQEVYLDQQLVPAPEGTSIFTGPGGCLLSFKLSGGSWMLEVDGVDVESHNAAILRSGVPSAPPGVRDPVAPATMTSLPPGVSLDMATGKYTANIRMHGRFVNLGEFSTPEEASNRYQEEKKK